MYTEHIVINLLNGDTSILSFVLTTLLTCTIYLLLMVIHPCSKASFGHTKDDRQFGFIAEGGRVLHSILCY